MRYNTVKPVAHLRVEMVYAPHLPVAPRTPGHLHLQPGSLFCHLSHLLFKKPIEQFPKAGVNSTGWHSPSGLYAAPFWQRLIIWPHVTISRFGHCSMVLAGQPGKPNRAMELMPLAWRPVHRPRVQQRCENVRDPLRGCLKVASACIIVSNCYSCCSFMFL